METFKPNQEFKDESNELEDLADPEIQEIMKAVEEVQNHPEVYEILKQIESAFDEIVAQFKEKFFSRLSFLGLSEREFDKYLSTLIIDFKRQINAILIPGQFKRLMREVLDLSDPNREHFKELRSQVDELTSSNLVKILKKQWISKEALDNAEQEWLNSFSSLIGPGLNTRGAYRFHKGVAVSIAYSNPENLLNTIAHEFFHASVAHIDSVKVYESTIDIKWSAMKGSSTLKSRELFQRFAMSFEEALAHHFGNYYGSVIAPAYGGYEATAYPRAMQIIFESLELITKLVSPEEFSAFARETMNIIYSQWSPDITQEQFEQIVVDAVKRITSYKKGLIEIYKESNS